MKRLLLVLLACCLLCSCAQEAAFPEDVIDTEYFALTLPENLQGKCEYNIEIFGDGTYELVLYQEENHEIFNIRLFPMYEATEGYFIGHGILATPNGDYELYSRLPEGMENTEENSENIVKDFYAIATNLTPKKGCEHLVPQPETPAEEVENIVIETEYYTVTMPQAWVDNCTYTFEESSYGPTIVTFYENTSYAAGKGGKLCSIQLVPEQVEWSSVEDASLFGWLKTPDGLFHILNCHPWETQCNKDTYETFEAMRKLTPDLFGAITPKEGCELIRA